MTAAQRKRLASGLALLAVSSLVVSLVAAGAAPALAEGTFKAADHDWVVGLNAGTVHNVPSGGRFKFCGTQAISAITPDITYTGAPVGKHYTEEVTGPAGDITINSTHTVDGDVTKLVFTKSSGVWDNTYAIMSFPGSVGHSTLPAGRYTFEVFVSGAPVASTSVRLVYKAGC